MSVANIINLSTVSDIQSWLKEKNNVYIGRQNLAKNLAASKWGNPHQLSKCNNSREEAVTLYAQFIKGEEKLLKSISELKDKNLGCWCAPLLCHGAVLHYLAGNTPVYQSRKMEQSPTNPPSPTKNEQEQAADSTAPIQLDRQVSDALQAMNDILEAIKQDISSTLPPSPLPTNADTPSSSKAETPTISTAETNKIYETLVESSSSSPSSSDKDSPKSNADAGQLSRREQAELESKLKRWRSRNSESLQMPPSLRYYTERPYCSAPTTPMKNQVISSTSSANNTLFNPPTPFSYLSTSTHNLSSSNDTPPNKDYAMRIQGFLASKVDLLALSINAIQKDLSNLRENLQLAMNEQIPSTINENYASVNDRLCYTQNEFDDHKTVMEQKFQTLKDENTQLKERLEDYILKETERENNIKEILSNPQNPPCMPDILSLKEELEVKLLELDTRLIEVEQYSRRESLVISGIPSNVPQKQLQKKVIDILGLIGLMIIPDDIAACHRLYNPPHSEYPAKVVVRFCNRKVVNFCLEHREDLQQKAYDKLRLNLRFFDSICAKNEEVLRISKWLKRENKIHDYFIRNGFVKVVIEEHGRPWKISHPNVLRKKFENIPLVV